jgi:hypothetical protein
MSGVAEVHFDLATLEAGLDRIRESPRDRGTLELICRRPAVEERELVDEATLDLHEGLLGDNWLVRGSKSTDDGSADRDAQLTLMNIRSVELIAGSPERHQLAGDQLFVDLLLSEENLPPGTRLQIGEATIERTAPPHRGCGKFLSRFGVDALKFVNSDVGRELNLRGVNARVIEGGRIRRGDAIEVLR